jgi:hypothetical protein
VSFHEQYLGDAVYASVDGSYLILHTRDEQVRQVIYLEPAVLKALEGYVARGREQGLLP